MRFPGLRVAVAVLAGYALLNAPAASAAGCGQSVAHEAFDLQGLKSELMVTALSCRAQDNYNSFVAKFRGQLLQGEKALDSYFRTTYGSAARRQYDDYITQLANIQSERGLQSGTIFCDQRMAMFDEVKELKDMHDLANYAEAKDILQPASFESCSAPKAVDHSRTTRRKRARSSKA